MAASKLTWSYLPQTLLCFAVFISNFLVVYSDNILNNNSTNNAESKLPPTVLIALAVRNEGHALPWVLGQLEILNYPKDRISFWIRSDHNVDNTSAILKEWASYAKKLYHSIDLKIDEKSFGYADEESPCHWVRERFIHVMNLRQKALEKAKRVWADYLFLMDADIVIENQDLFSILIQQNKPIISPQLNVSTDSLYSNFWCGINEHGYYQRTPDYEPIVRWHKQGCFEVPMVHSVYFIDMNHVGVKKLSFNKAPPEYKGPFDDIIQFAFSAKYAGMSMHIINTEFFGHLMVPLESKDTLEDEIEQFLHIKLEMIVIEPRLRPSRFISFQPVKSSKLGFDQIYLINLIRRPQRRRKMLMSLRELGIEIFILNAVDGKTLNDTYLKQLGVKQLPGYADPYHGRQMTMGEIGCFLSHFVIWKDVVDNNYRKALVFEDDVRFEIFFRQKLEKLLYECEYIVRNWDLVYLGRKRLFRKPEPDVPGTTMLVWPNYSYWTLSYILTLEGAQKLLDADPLSKMIPVDEYIPVMFDRHPEDEWKSFFFPRNLVGLSAEPLLVYPTHYTGEAEYLSDTEDSDLIEGEEEEEDENEIAAAGLNVESPKVEL
ncbi:procollagen galactosyltransferase 1 [Octopus bimaculoides]|nr:procollagen galactosyltransferase 1 [Octopus bimaculoides]